MILRSSVAGRIFFYQLLMKQIYTRIFTDTFNKIQAEHAEFIAGKENKGFNKKILLIAVVACVSLSCIEYIGKDDGYYVLINFMSTIGFAGLADRFRFFIGHGVNQQLFSLGYWVVVILVFYILVPLLLIVFVLKIILLISAHKIPQSVNFYPDSLPG